MKTIIVIGGAGFIGSHTVVELVSAGYKPVIVDNFNNSMNETIKRLETLLDQPLTHYNADYKDRAAMEKIFDEHEASGIIHFAAYKAVGESVRKPLDYYDNNVSGFIDLLKMITDRNIHNFVFSSSAAVYGNPPEECVTEETVCRPTSPYGWSKYMDEVILRDLCNAIPEFGGVSLRYFNVVGAHETTQIGELPKGMPQNLLPIIVDAVAQKIPPLTVYGTDYPTPDGTCQRDYVHVVDLAKAHVAALQRLESGAAGYHVYNIGTGKPTSVLELIETFQKVNGVSVPYVLGGRRPGDPAACYASAAKAETELNWKATKTTEDAVRDAWQWHLSITQNT
jgi:UDP-glucose 4-epimerase